MSTIETILSRMMNDPAFADAVFADIEKALTEYGLSENEIEKLKGLTHAQFEKMTPDERKSMAATTNVEYTLRVTDTR